MEWTSLTRATTDFLLTFLVHLILATQTLSPLFVLSKTKGFDEESVEEVFDKGLSNTELTQGWMMLLKGRKAKNVLDGLGLALDERQAEVVNRGWEIVKRILSSTQPVLPDGKRAR